MSTDKDPLDLMTPEQREWFNKHVFIRSPEELAQPIEFARVEEEAPKPVELTEAEIESLAVRFVRDAGGLGVDLLDSDAERLVEAAHDEGWVSPEEAKAREAAARREALLEAEAIRAEAEQCLLSLRAKVARVEALAHRARLGTVSASDIKAALAEPERDEESGR